MKQPEKLIIDKPIVEGSIYLLQQWTVKCIVSKGSLERKGLTGKWNVVKEFKDEILER